VTMAADPLALLVKNRLLLAGAPPFEAPYAAREAIAFGRAIGMSAEADIIRLALAIRALEPILQSKPAERGLVVATLGRVDVAPSARLDFIERTWLGGASGAGAR
jgi:hypothetical protein